MRKVGRTLKRHEIDVRDRSIRFRVTKEEQELLEDAAGRKRMSLSAWMRDALFDAYNAQLAPKNRGKR